MASEGEWKLPNGRWCRAEVLNLANGGSITVLTDITELKRAEAAVKASETRYRRLFEAAQDGILILSETGIITDVNPYLLEMLGYSEAQLLGSHLCDIGFVADRDLCQKTFRSLQQSGYVRYDGLPWGYELGSLVGGIVEAGREEPTLRPESVAALEELDRDLTLDVFVTPT